MVAVQLFLALSLIPTITFAGTCSNSNFKLCYNTYFENFELATDPFPEYRAYKMVREMMLVEEGPSGQTKECGFQNALISCIGASTENDCVSTPNFASLFNISESEATQYVQDYFMMKYTCNAGYSDAMKYFYCLESVGLYHTDSLVNCSTTEQNALGNGIGCSAYNDYIGCLKTVYIANCGADIQKYICNLEVSGISKAAPECASALPDCSKTTKTIVSKKFIPRKSVTVSDARKVLLSGKSIFP
uniref:Secreted protein n=1 Tax=Panagrolaimus sp. PS1159 TaxID=55785 RepID=A0AC35F1I7_9BILA